MDLYNNYYTNFGRKECSGTLDFPASVTWGVEIRKVNARVILEGKSVGVHSFLAVNLQGQCRGGVHSFLPV